MEKKVRILISIVVVLTVGLVYVSCQNSENESDFFKNIHDSKEVLGCGDFKKSLLQLSNSSSTRTNSGMPSEEDIKNLVDLSQAFLLQNNITAEDLEIDDEEILVVVAMSLLDYQKIVYSSTRTTAGGCLIEALGVREVVNSAGKGAVKYVAKAVAKVALKRAIPYVGWGMFAWDFIACVAE